MSVRPIWARRRIFDLLRIENLNLNYGASQVLFGVNISVNQGDVVSLLGRNGMGKSTTVNSILGLVRPKSGRIFFDNIEIQNLESYRISQLGISLVPEGRQVFPNLTVQENLIATASNRLNFADPWTLAKIIELFPQLGSLLSSNAALLSGGEQQMLSIGRALMTNPKLLILDEATEGLAPLIRKEIWRSLNQLKSQGLSILIIDKNIKNLQQIASHHAIIEKGKIVWTGSSADLELSAGVKDQFLGI